MKVRNVSIDEKSSFSAINMFQGALVNLNVVCLSHPGLPVVTMVLADIQRRAISLPGYTG